MEILTCTLAERPELVDQFWAIGDMGMPEFMLHDVSAGLYFDHVVESYSDYVVLACDAQAPDRVLARGLSVPFAMGSGARTALPAGGWDQILAWAHGDLVAGRTPTHVSALEINVVAEARGRGLSARVLEAMKNNARAVAGVSELVAPVRPNHKHLHPRTAMGDYVAVLRDDGLPADPWLRVHVRAGAEIVAVCPVSMTIGGTLADWRRWTGLPFDTEGDVEVPGALGPVLVRSADDFAVYIEANVWVRHRIGP